MQLHQHCATVEDFSYKFAFDLQQSLCLAFRDLGCQVLIIALSRVFGCELKVFLVTFQVGMWSAACGMC